ncbi:MAG: acyl-CoA thioesterase domain-containing protein, partial [Caulobacterales bacterium]
PDTLNGRAVVGLLGFAMEQAFGEPGLIPVRFTVDMFRLPRNAPLRIDTHMARAGGRLKLAHVEMFCEDAPIARANCQFLRETENPANPTWQAPAWNAPPPQKDHAPQSQLLWEVQAIDAKHRRIILQEAETANSGAAPEDQPGNPPVLGPLAAFEARQVWARETREMVGGFPHTPFTRIAAAADYANPLANSSRAGIDYVNSDITVYLSRLPQTEWIGFEFVHHLATKGIAVGECWLHDEHGPIGAVIASGVAQRKR